MDRDAGRGAVAQDARAAARDRRRLRSGRARVRERRSRSIRRAPRSAAAGRCSLRAPPVRRGLSAGEQGAACCAERLAAADPDGEQAQGARGAGQRSSLRTDAAPLRRSCSNATSAIRRPAAGTRKPIGSARRRASTIDAAAGLVPTGARRRRGSRTSSIRSRSSAASSSSIDADVAAARRRCPTGSSTCPAGEFWFGDARRAAADAVPRHGADSPAARPSAFLIAQHETTYGEWIAFLDALPAGERAQLAARRRRRAARGSLRAARGRRRPGSSRSSRPRSATRRAPGNRSSTSGASSASARTGCASRSPASRAADVRTLPRLAAQHGAGARRAAVHRARMGARRARRRRSHLPARRRAAAGRRELRPDLRPRRRRRTDRTRSVRTRPRAARSGSTIWRATCWSSSPRRRSRTRW